MEDLELMEKKSSKKEINRKLLKKIIFEDEKERIWIEKI